MACLCRLGNTTVPSRQPKCDECPLRSMLRRPVAAQMRRRSTVCKRSIEVSRIRAQSKVTPDTLQPQVIMNALTCDVARRPSNPARQKDAAARPRLLRSRSRFSCCSRHLRASHLQPDFSAARHQRRNADFRRTLGIHLPAIRRADVCAVTHPAAPLRRAQDGRDGLDVYAAAW